MELQKHLTNGYDLVQKINTLDGRFDREKTRWTWQRWQNYSFKDYTPYKAHIPDL